MAKRYDIIYLVFLFVVFMLTSCAPPQSMTQREIQPQVTEEIPATPRPEEPAPTRSGLSPVKKEFIATVKHYLGTPYKWGGIDESGMDCSGLVITIYQQVLNMSLPHSSRQLYHLGKPVNRENLTLGDLIFFATDNGPRISHVGIYLADANFVHASSSKGVTISNIATNPYYLPRFVGARRITAF